MFYLSNHYTYNLNVLLGHLNHYVRLCPNAGGQGGGHTGGIVNYSDKLLRWTWFLHVYNFSGCRSDEPHQIVFKPFTKKDTEEDC